MTVELAMKCLAESPHVRGCGIKVEERNGRIVLTGRVASYYQKSMAQEAIRAADPTVQVDNQITVDS